VLYTYILHINILHIYLYIHTLISAASINILHIYLDIHTLISAASSFILESSTLPTVQYIHIHICTYKYVLYIYILHIICIYILHIYLYIHTLISAASSFILESSILPTVQYVHVHTYTHKYIYYIYILYIYLYIHTLMPRASFWRVPPYLPSNIFICIYTPINMCVIYIFITYNMYIHITYISIYSYLNIVCLELHLGEFHLTYCCIQSSCEVCVRVCVRV